MHFDKDRNVVVLDDGSGRTMHLPDPGLVPDGFRVTIVSPDGDTKVAVGRSTSLTYYDEVTPARSRWARLLGRVHHRRVQVAIPEWWPLKSTGDPADTDNP